MKKLFFILTIIISAHTHAMELEIKKESEKEFIERTKALKTTDIPEKYLDHINYSPYRQFYLHAAYSPDNKFIALLNKVKCFNIGPKGLYRGDASKPTLVIIDTTNNQKLFETILEEKDGKEISKLALSRDGKTIATIHNKDIDENIITITNFETKQTESHTIPYYLTLPQEHPTIAFNKQGTDLIIHGHKSNLLRDSDDEFYPTSPLHPSHPLWAIQPYKDHEIIHITISTSEH